MMYLSRVLGAVGFLFMMSVSLVYAQTSPVVTSLAAAPSTVNTAALTNLSWAIENSSGYSLQFSCQPGVTVFADSGAAEPCDTRIAFNQAGSGSAGFSFVNVTGMQQRVAIRMYPKDTSGADINSGGMTTFVYVNPVANAISDFTSSTLTPASGSPFILSWASHYIPAVNMKADCLGDVVISLSTATLPVACGSILFSTDLAASGSQTITAINKTMLASNLTVTLFPVISTGSFDGTNAKSIQLSVAGALPPADASASVFMSSGATAISDATTTFSWVTANAAGANIQFACLDNVAIFDGNGNTLPCGRPAFPTAITAASSTQVRIKNLSTYRRGLKVLLFLLRADGTYVAAQDKDVLLALLAPGEGVSVAQPMSTSSTPTATSSVSQKSHTPITLVLRKGVRHSQVSILQTFLSLDPTIYPEGSVTGLFGPATVSAVKRFQKRYGIASEKDSAYGIVGPTTRTKINALLKP